MEFKDIIAKRRSTRKFLDRPVEPERTEHLLQTLFTAPSARNARSTRVMTVSDRELLGKLSQMRDYGSAFLKNAPLAFVIAGDPSASGLWRENAAIAATILQLACVDEGMASCWVHVDGRPHKQDEPDGMSAEEYMRTLLPLPEDWSVLCIIAAGYSDFHPADLPPYDREKDIIRL
ncbi:MAG: nitroreductase family protein [Alistipes sp.]|nr:nitroreductase family protein [Alistipes sp.]